MAYNNGFNGDSVSLQYILQTLDSKTILIPGITANANLSVSAMGEVAYYYKRGTSTVTTGNVGDSITYAAKGVTREDISLTSAITIGAVLPHVNFATIQAPVIADRVIMESISAANQHNTLAVTYLEDNSTNFYKSSDGTVVVETTATSNSALTYSTVYDEIIDMKKAFNVKNKAKGMKPTAIIVSEAVYADLLKSDQFIRKEQAGDAVVYDGVVGRVAGLQVVVSPDTAVTTSADESTDIIMLNAEGFAAPLNVRSLAVVDATAAGYPLGTIVAGEIGFGFKIADPDLVLVRRH